MTALACIHRAWRGQQLLDPQHLGSVPSPPIVRLIPL